jgi:hypothetical protein
MSWKLHSFSGGYNFTAKSLRDREIEDKPSTSTRKTLGEKSKKRNQVPCLLHRNCETSRLGCLCCWNKPLGAALAVDPLPRPGKIHIGMMAWRKKKLGPPSYQETGVAPSAIDSDVA